MPRINPEGQITRAERLVTVIAVIGAVLVHLVALFGWGRIYQWTQEEQKKERLMVIRRVRDIAPPRETVSRPAAPGSPPPKGRSAARNRRPRPRPNPRSRSRGPSRRRSRNSPRRWSRSCRRRSRTRRKLAEHGDNSVSVVTDLPAASFIVSGPAEYRGSGTFWVRKGAPPGIYTVTFNPVAGFSTPPVQTKELVAKGQIVFVGKYRRSTEVDRRQQQSRRPVHASTAPTAARSA